MLITINENGTNPTSFQTRFKNNIILPRYSTLRLKDAFIGKSHNFVLLTNHVLKLTANEDGGTIHDITLTSGTYGLNELANHITAEAKAVVSANNLGLDFSFIYSNPKGGYTANSWVLHIQAQRHNANIMNYIPITANTEGFTLTAFKNTTLVKTTTASGSGASLTATNELNVYVIQNPADATISSWAQFIQSRNKEMKFWLSGTTAGTNLQPPLLHSTPSDVYGSLMIEDDGEGKNYWVGLSKSNGSANSVADNTFTSLTSLTGIPIVALVIKDTNGTFTDGEVYFYENDGTGAGLVEVAKYSDATTPFTDGWKVGMSLVEGKAPQYWVSTSLASTTWNNVAPHDAVARYSSTEADGLLFSFAQYTQATNNTTPTIQNIRGTFVGTSQKVDDYGEYIKWDWNGLQDEMGYTADINISDTSASGDLASMKEPNNLPIEIYGDETGEKKTPYVNVMIDNLPIVSYTATNTNKDNELEESKCLASIPAYNYNGSFADSDNIIYSDSLESQTIQLNNSEEISISDMRFRLQYSDGSYPLDLETPVSFVIEVKSEAQEKYSYGETNGFKM